MQRSSYSPACDHLSKPGLLAVVLQVAGHPSAPHLVGEPVITNRRIPERQPGQLP